MTDTAGIGCEYTAPCSEYNHLPEYCKPAAEYDGRPESPASAPKKRRNIRLLAYIAGALAFVVLGNSLTGSSGGGLMAAPLRPADTPETYIGVLVSPSDASWTQVFTISGGASDAVGGLSYDEASNTLTLNNAAVERIETNMMGNGFTIELIGSSSVGTLSVWGWDYGGSLTITGAGSLTLNSGGSYAYGLIMYAECSESRLLIGENVTLEARGSVAAVYINETVYNGGRPLIELGASAVVTGGEVDEFATDDGVIGHYLADAEGMPVAQSDYSASRDATFVNTAQGDPALTVKIQPS